MNFKNETGTQILRNKRSIIIGRPYLTSNKNQTCSVNHSRRVANFTVFSLILACVENTERNRTHK